MANCRVCHERPAEIGLRCRPCHNSDRRERHYNPLPRTCAVCGKQREYGQVKYCLACAPEAMAAVRVAYEKEKLVREKEERRARGKIRPGRKVQPAVTVKPKPKRTMTFERRAKHKPEAESRLDARMDIIARIDAMRSQGNHEAARKLHEQHFRTPYRESVNPVKIRTGNRPV